MKRGLKMQKTTEQFALTIFILMSLVLPSYGFGNASMSLPSPEQPTITSEMTSLTIPVRQQQDGKIVKVPLFSEKYADLPVAMIEGEPITVKDFSLRIASMHDNMSGSDAPKKQNFSDLLDRMIAVKLVKQEALNIGFDRTPEVETQVKNFALKSMIQELLAKQITNIQVPDEEVEELYQQMALEAKLLTYQFTEEADAKAVLEKTQNGGDFKQLADDAVQAGKAQGGEEPEFARLNDLFPSVAKAVFDMEPGSISEVFKGPNGYLLFRLEERQTYEDPEVRLAATNRLLQQKSKEKQYDYLQSLIDKYASYDEEVKESLDFTKIAYENPGIKGTEVFPPLVRDKRPLATFTADDQTVNITVAEIAEKVKATMYHGLDREIDGPTLDDTKEDAIWNESVAIAGRLEAQAQGVDQLPEFKDKIDKFEEKLLFETFMAKAVAPGIKVPEDEAKAYYYNHLEDYSSPLMLKLKSLAFTNREAALDAFKKLQAGSDFKWVSANSTNQADPDNKDLLNFGDKLLAASALPHDLSHEVATAQPGDVFFYEGENNIFYTLVADSVFASEAKTYQEVRQEVGKIVYARLINEALADWVSKLKDAYETQMFLVEE